MRAKLSSLPSPPLPPSPSNLPTKPSSAKFKFSRKPSPCTCKNVSQQSTGGRGAAASTRFGHPEPPWLVPQPHYVDEGFVFNHQVKPTAAAGTPLSLRLLQLRKKSDGLALSARVAAGTELGPFGSAVWSLACLLEDFKKSVMPVGREEDMVRVLRDGRYSMVWLFQRVFSGSPNLAVGVLAMAAEFMVESTEAAMFSTAAAQLSREEEEEGTAGEEFGNSWEEIDRMSDYTCWSDIGILDESETEGRTEKDAAAACPDYERKMMAYEDLIARDVKEPNSMILSNYAQLLYQYKKDYDRARTYFDWSVMVEPVDGEAMSRYALFLWHQQRDINMAEEMFLQAIAADPENNYHQSNYALFLWKTGGTDTCYPLSDSSNGSKDEANAEAVDIDKELPAQSWSDIGILDGAAEKQAAGAGDDWSSSYMRRKIVYERAIIRGKADSLVLSNYAQLLYQYEKDFDRANYYFQLAVATEPVDAEAMGRYALFLWHERGDVEMAEEMFLRATAADSGSSHHQQNYAWFLWKTGGTDTCYPLDDCVVDDDDDNGGGDDEDGEKGAEVLLT